MNNYEQFLEQKRHRPANYGIEPSWMPDGLFDYQRYVTEYAIRKGRCAVFLDTGLGKTIIEITTAVNYRQHTGKPTLILTPLAVAFQFIKEAEKFGVQNWEPRDWLMILAEEVGEANREALEARFANVFPEHYTEDAQRMQRLRAELIQVAAVAVAAVESLDRNELNNANTAV